MLTNSYGAVITHIEPEHLATVPIPDAPASIKKRVNDLILGCSITGITQARSIRSKLYSTPAKFAVRYHERIPATQIWT